MSSPPRTPDADWTTPETIVEFGAEPAAVRRRLSLTGLLAALAADPRVVPLSAVLAGVAGFGSLISEWQITTFQASTTDSGRSGFSPQAIGVADLGALGAGYLVGLLVLAGALTLVMFGPAAGRRHIRLLGLSTGGVLLALLAGIASDLDNATRAIDHVFTLDPSDGQLLLSYGRGLWCALIGVAGAILALALAERHRPPAAGSSGEEAAGESGEALAGAPRGAVGGESGEAVAGEPGADPAGRRTRTAMPAGEPEPAWSWRRPRVTEDRDRLPDEPLDLTVAPARPFTSLTDDRDGFTGGISG